MNSDLVQIAGWSGYLSGGAAIVAFVAIAGFFAGVKLLGPVNDVALAVMALTAVPLALILGTHYPGRSPALNLTSTILGLAGMITFGVNNGLMVAGVTQITTYERVADPVLGINMVAFGALGVWLAITGYLLYQAFALPAGYAWLAMLSGLGFLSMSAGYWILGGYHPLTMFGGVVWQLGYPAWAIWTAALILSGGFSPVA